MTSTAKKAGKKDFSEGVKRICAHNVEWWLNSPETYLSDTGIY
jgi:hypothetical protein